MHQSVLRRNAPNTLGCKHRPLAWHKALFRQHGGNALASLHQHGTRAGHAHALEEFAAIRIKIKAVLQDDLCLLVDTPMQLIPINAQRAATLGKVKPQNIGALGRRTPTSGNSRSKKSITSSMFRSIYAQHRSTHSSPWLYAAITALMAKGLGSAWPKTRLNKALSFASLNTRLVAARPAKLNVLFTAVHVITRAWGAT